MSAGVNPLRLEPVTMYDRNDLRLCYRVHTFWVKGNKEVLCLAAVFMRNSSDDYG